MIARPLYVAERVPARFIGGRFHHWPWRVVLVTADGRRRPAGSSNDGQGRRYQLKEHAIRAARELNRSADEARAAAAERPAPGVDAALAFLEGRR